MPSFFRSSRDAALSPSQDQRRLALRQHVLAFLFYCIVFAVFFYPATLSHRLVNSKVPMKCDVPIGER